MERYIELNVFFWHIERNTRSPGDLDEVEIRRELKTRHGLDDYEIEGLLEHVRL